MERLDRLLGELPGWYNTFEGGVIYEWMLSVSEELDRFDIQKGNLTQSLFIDTAIADELDTIGALFRLPRRPGESDLLYRSRIKAAASIFRASGTKPGIQAALVDLVGVDPAFVEITEDFPSNPLKFRVKITFVDEESIALKDAARDAVEDAKAAGTYPIFQFALGGALLTDTVAFTDSVLITSVGPTLRFTVEESLIEGAALVS